MRGLITGIALAAGFVAAALAQESPAQPQVPASPAPAAPQADAPTATNETYRMKDGGLYQPPAVRPASPAADTSHYGRT